MSNVIECSSLLFCSWGVCCGALLNMALFTTCVQYGIIRVKTHRHIHKHTHGLCECTHKYIIVGVMAGRLMVMNGTPAAHSVSISLSCGHSVFYQKYA